MAQKRLVTFTAAGLVALAAGTALPATAQELLDESSSTEATFSVPSTLPAGALVVGQLDPTATAQLGEAAPDETGRATITGDLPTMVVTAPAGSAGNWSVTIQMTEPFTAPRGKVPAEQAVAYLAGDPIATLDMVATDYATTAEAGVNLGLGGQLVGGTVGAAGGTVTYAPRVTVDIPPNTPPGTYTGTIVQTVSAGS